MREASEAIGSKLFTTVHGSEIYSCNLLRWRALQDSDRAVFCPKS
jgi:hypothetical protein